MHPLRAGTLSAAGTAKMVMTLMVPHASGMARLLPVTGSIVRNGEPCL